MRINASQRWTTTPEINTHTKIEISLRMTILTDRGTYYTSTQGILLCDLWPNATHPVLSGATDCQKMMRTTRQKGDPIDRDIISNETHWGPLDPSARIII